MSVHSKIYIAGHRGMVAAASVHVMSLPQDAYERHTNPIISHINVGCGHDITIRELAEAIRRTVGYSGEISFDPSKPDGTLRKLMDSSRLNDLGWHPRIALEQGLQLAYADFKKNASSCI